MSIIFSFPILLGSIFLIIIIRAMMKKNSNNYYNHVDEFMKREQLANGTIKNIKDVSLEYVYPNIEHLPFTEFTEEQDSQQSKKIIKKQNAVKRKLELDMVKLPINLSNTEVKEFIGVNNFEKVTLMEAHYNGYIRALYEWAVELFEIKNYEDCELVLLEIQRLNGDISNAYVLLATLYDLKGDIKKIEELMDIVNSCDLSLKDSTLNSISNILSK